MNEETLPLNTVESGEENNMSSLQQFSQLEVEPLYSDNNTLTKKRCPKALQCCPCRCYTVAKHCSCRRAAIIMSSLTCFVLFMYITVQVGVIATFLTTKPPSRAPQPDDSTTINSFFNVRHGPEGAPPTQESFEFLINKTALSKLFLFTELIERGDGHTAVSHTVPSENVPMYFNLSHDNTQLLLYRKQMAVRASNARDQVLLKDGISDFLLASLPISSNDDDNMITVLGTSLIEKHFGVPIELDAFAESQTNTIRVVSVKGYPKNVNFVLEIKSKDKQDTGSLGSSTIRTFLSLALLPEKPMVSRVADHRIGYFAEEYTNVGVHPRGDAGSNKEKEDTLPNSLGAFDVDQQISVINKWRLEKDVATCDDSTNQMGCLPIKPIIYYVDPTVPSVWQKYVKIGIELWQPSFAALGFKNTPRAVLPGDVDFPKDYDSGDIRYASVSFAISRDYVFSVGPSVTDPRTGEILDADIGFSQEWVHAFSGSIGRDTVNALSGMSGASGHKNHRHQDHRRLRSRHNCNKERLAAFIENTGMSMRALADAADSSGRVPVEIIGRGLAGVTVHEVGHTLGLRHNFAGSSTIPYASIYDQTKTSTTGSSSSVMDYVGPVIAPTAALQKNTLVFPDGHIVGAYDRLAIEYGYTTVSDEQPTVQHASIHAIAEKLNTNHLVFATDDDASFDTDPLARRYDMTNNPIQYAQDRILVGARMRTNAEKYSKWYPNDGVTSSSLLLKSALRVQARAAGNAAYHLGGRVLDHHFSSTTTTDWVQPIHPGYQEQALSVIRGFLEDDYWLPSANSSAATALNQHVVYVNPYGLGMEYGLDVAELSMQYVQSVDALLTTITDSTKLMRVHKTSRMLLSSTVTTWTPTSWAPKKGAATTMSVEDVLRTLSDGVWCRWKYYSIFANRNRWSVINNWVSRVIALYKECRTNALLFQVEIDVRTIVNEMIYNLTSGYLNNIYRHRSAAMSAFMNTTLNKMNNAFVEETK